MTGDFEHSISYKLKYDKNGKPLHVTRSGDVSKLVRNNK